MGLSATELLRTAAETIEERGKQRDNLQGERSMFRAVRMFNVMIGDDVHTYPVQYMP